MANQLWNNEYFRTVIMIIIIIGVILAFWFGLRWGLNTDYPMLAVASGSMSLPKGVPDPGWASPFSPTLHTGDLIIIEGVDASQIHPGPPPVGDILVFHESPGSDELIVHRAIGNTTGTDGTFYFVTQGDNNEIPGPPNGGLVPVSDVVGKVVMRIPWFGYIALDMRNSSGILVIVVLIILFIVVESIVSEVQHRKNSQDKKETTETSEREEA